MEKQELLEKLLEGFNNLAEYYNKDICLPENESAFRIEFSNCPEIGEDSALGIYEKSFKQRYFLPNCCFGETTSTPPSKKRFLKYYFDSNNELRYVMHQSKSNTYNLYKIFSISENKRIAVGRIDINKKKKKNDWTDLIIMTDIDDHNSEYIHLLWAEILFYFYIEKNSIINDKITCEETSVSMNECCTDLYVKSKNKKEQPKRLSWKKISESTFQDILLFSKLNNSYKKALEEQRKLSAASLSYVFKIAEKENEEIQMEEI